MNVLVVADGHYYQTPDGTVYAESVYDYTFYKRYLLSFDKVFAAIRVTQLTEKPVGKKMCSGENVTFLPLPPFSGAVGYAKNFFGLNKEINECISLCDCAVFRLPSITGNLFWKHYKKTSKPYAVEIVGDPWENFGSRETGNRIILAVARHSWTNTVKNACRQANGASYVTEKYLQKRYPPRANSDKNAFTASYSSVELPDDKFGETRIRTKIGKMKISHVSNCFNSYGKGHLVVMDAIRKVCDKGCDVEVTFVGDGPLLEEFREYSRKLVIENRVHFTGRLANSEAVRDCIRSSDLFILPTFAEGLPRALLEAMAEGMPCLSSPVCGIPEILDDAYLCDFDDSDGYAEKIMYFYNNPDAMTEQSKRNLDVSKKYASSILNAKRKAFYDNLCEAVGAASK